MDLEPYTKQYRVTPFLKRLLRGITFFLFFVACAIAHAEEPVAGNKATAAAPADSAGANNVAPILLFNGSGTSPSDVAAIEALLSRSNLGYATVNSIQLNGMTESQISAHRLLIVPGGNFVKMGDGLTSNTSVNVRNAVKGGMNYLGICAGGFLAGHFPAPYNSFNLSSGVKFGFYNSGTRKAVVKITTREGPVLDQYWEDGPQFSGWGGVIGKYPDGTPAVVEGSLGQGWIILTGIHPEAPESWRRGMTFSTPASASAAYAMTLIDATLNRKDLAHY